MLRAERESARMSKITNDGLTRSGTGYSCTHMAPVGVKGLISTKVEYTSNCMQRRWNRGQRGARSPPQRWNCRDKSIFSSPLCAL